jgi:predicted Zn-dependent protease
MLPDRYDKTLLLLSGLILAAACALLIVSARHDMPPTSSVKSDRAMERALAQQARLAQLERLYAPVEALAATGHIQDALLKLEEISRSYPGEPHGLVLKADLLYRLGALEEAAARYADGVKRQGDYVDRTSPLSRRQNIEQVVQRAMETIARRRAAGERGPGLAALTSNINYLRSRLAGGCE